MALLERALELPPGERSGYIDANCAGDEELRAEVRSLLDEAEADDGFLESGRPGELVRETVEGLDADAGGPAASRVPDQIGPFKVLGLLGQGGMGTVYEAEQESPRRRIALKVLRTPFLAEQLRGRFERESEILGRLRHPGIAHIYHAGVIASGTGEPVPYFAMELVEGQPVTSYANSHGLDLRERLELVAKICDAVEHAHGHGVIHRDLKPDNILVDERGEPRILDFGVARIVDREMAGAAPATATGLLIGTLSYMSPEQVGARPDEIDARSDVYSLGVLAFELLAARLPIDVDAVSVPEAAMRIREVDPPHLGTLDWRFRGDVGTIVEKALDKEPGRRYASAIELAQDIRRYLAEEPIRARPPSGLYQLRKFARRNKAIVAGVLVAFLALLGGTLVATRQAMIAGKERAHAELQAYRARIAAAGTAVESHDTKLARNHLEAIPASRRGWEWRHLYSRLDQSARVIASGAGRYVELRFGRGAGELLVGDRSSVPWVVFAIPLSGAMRPGERFPVGMSRPQRVPPELRPAAMRLALLLRGESSVELLDPGGGEGATLLRCDDAGERSYSRALTADAGKVVMFSAGATSSTQRAQLCDLLTGQGGPEFVVPYAWTIGLSGDGKILAAVPKVEGQPSRVELFSTERGRRLRTLPVPLDDVTALDLSHDGGYVAGGSYNGVLRLWSVETGRLLAERRGHGGQYVSVVRIAPRGDRLVSGGSDQVIHLWSSGLTGEPLILHGHNAHVVDLRFSPDGSDLASVDSAGEIRLWDLDKNLSEPRVLRGHRSYVNPVRGTGDGRLIASGGWDGTVRLWDATTGEEVRVIELQGGVEADFGVTGLAIDGDDRRLAAGTTLGEVRVFDLASGRLLASSQVDSRLSRLAFAPGGARLFAGTTWEGLLILDARTLEVVERRPFGLPFAWSPDGSRLLLRDSETSLIVREGTSGPILARLEPVDDETTAAAWSPDGRRIVTASGSGVAGVWDAGDGKRLGSLSTHTGDVHAAAIHPDGTRVALGGTDGVLRLYDLESRASLLELRGHEAYIFDLAWSPDGETLVSSSGDGTLRLWRTRSRH